MVQTSFKRKKEELSVEQLRLRIADGTLRRGAKVKSAELYGDERWHSIESTTEWTQLAPVWHVPPPGPDLSKPALLTLVTVFGVLAGLLRIFAWDSGSGILGLVGLAELGNGIVWFMVVHAMWKSIHGSFTSTSPGEAVLLFFAPFYNIYWLFGAHMGFVRNYNLIASILQDRLGRSPARLQMWSFLLFCIAFLAWGLTSSAGNVAFGVAELVMVVPRALVLTRICDAVNALHALRRDSPDLALA